jgi:hypothetical protein
MTTIPSTQSSASGGARGTASEMSDAASDVASTVQQQASSLADASKREAKAVVADATTHAKDVLGQSRDQLRQQADEQLRSFAGTVSDIGRQLTSLANGQAQSGLVVDVANDLASTLSRFGDRVEAGGVEGTLGDVKRFARNKPGLFLLASLGGGLAAGRLLRSADPHAVMDAVKAEATGASDSGTSSSQRPALGSADPGATPLPSGTRGGVADAPAAVDEVDITTGI